MKGKLSVEEAKAATITPLVVVESVTNAKLYYIQQAATLAPLTLRVKAVTLS